MKARHLLLVLFLCAPRLGAQISPGPLSRVHTELEGVTNCTRCHERAAVISGARCLDCHKEIGASVKAGTGLHARNSKTACESCHKEHLGLDATTTRFDPSTFDHATVGFVLNGKHAALQCRTCHTPSLMKAADRRPASPPKGRVSYLGLIRECSACHEDKHGGTLSKSCGTCHTSEGWKPAQTFEHASTSFPLLGKHASVECVNCHASFRQPSTTVTFASKEFSDCAPCHTSPHRPGFSTQPCRSCHGPDGWRVTKGFDHSTTRFALVGKHSTVTCASCHPDLAKQDRATPPSFSTKAFSDCSPCHSSPHAASFSQRACSSCHSSQAWSAVDPKSFDHSLTGYALSGKHASAACVQCHPRPAQGGSFKSVFQRGSLKCAACHEDIHRGRFAASYANDCVRCHNDVSFRPSLYTMEMHQRSEFPLRGAHAATMCDLCHRKPDLNGFLVLFSSTRCEACHADRHKGQFADVMRDRSCASCHSEVGWESVKFDHRSTSFPLVGRHAGVTCASCHTRKQPDGSPITRYKGTASTCADCHKDIHEGQFSLAGVTDCAVCHAPADWKSLSFRHDAQSRFSLTGAHKNTPCRGCHPEERANGKRFIRYKPLGTSCEACHKGKI